MRRTALLFSILCLLALNVSAQTNTEKANAKLESAIKLMDDGKMDESIKLLNEAKSLDPGQFNYDYEIAYAHYLKEDYKTAITLLEKLKDHKDIVPAFYQLLGNSYDVIGNSSKAFEVYDQGLIKFPNAGMLYLEKGNVHLGKNELLKALPFYERGINADPMFSSNYYRAALIFFRTTEEVWAMIYGELMMNLDRNSKRTQEISKLLYDTYKSEIKFTSDTSFSVSFSKQPTITIDPKDLAAGPPRVAMFAYEPTLTMALVGEKAIDLASLNRIRKRFLEYYFKNNLNKIYPNVLMDYQKKIIDAGHFEAYNYWLLMQGDLDGFKRWYAANEEQFNKFAEWYVANPIKIDDTNKFTREKY